MSTAPIVSICVPTFNRARYLQSLLFSLTEHLQGFPFSYEVFVGDNASEDNTGEVVEQFKDVLPLRYVRHDSNLGSGPNWQYLLTHAKGRYFVYVADDDGLLGGSLAQAITVLEAVPRAGVAYAPWKILDLVADKDLGQFYSQDDDVLVEQGDFTKLLTTLLRYRMFPEIAIYRRDVLLAVMPRVSEQAFYAFVHAAEFAQQSAVLFLKDPFYVQVTNYFPDHHRQQAGINEAEHAWDRYRGGLEHVLGRASPQLDMQKRVEFLLAIQDLVSDRMGVAVRLRMQRERDPIETYYLAYRLKALGAERMLPAPLPVIAAQAAIRFLCTDVELNRGMAQLLCVGQTPAPLRQLIEKDSRLPVRFVDSMGDVGQVDAATLLFVLNGVGETGLLGDCPGRVMTEKQLMGKFVS